MTPKVVTDRAIGSDAGRVIREGHRRLDHIRCGMGARHDDRTHERTQFQGAIVSETMAVVVVEATAASEQEKSQSQEASVVSTRAATPAQAAASKAIKEGDDRCAMGLKFKEITRESQDDILKYVIKSQLR